MLVIFFVTNVYIEWKNFRKSQLSEILETILLKNLSLVGCHQRRSDTFMCTIYEWWFPYVSNYASRQLDVMDSGKIVLVMTISVRK